MTYLFIGAFALVLLLWAINWAANANAEMVRKFGRYMGAFLLTAAGIFLASRGAFGVAGPVLLGAFLLATGVRIPGFGGGQKASGQTSQVETPYLKVVLDHDTGTMDGDILEGQFKGRKLSDLDRDDLTALYDELVSADAEGARLLDAYLARRFQGEWQEEANTGGAQAGAASSAAMNREEALEVLGLAEGATAADIRAAHRRMMKKFHPDQGGSTYFAARINQAKDLLLGS